MKPRRSTNFFNTYRKTWGQHSKAKLREARAGTQRPFEKPRAVFKSHREQHGDGVSPTKLIGGFLLAAAFVQMARTAIQGARELRYYRACEKHLHTTWMSIPGLVGKETLCMHARAYDQGGSVLPPMILIHGYGIGSSYFVPLAAHLAGYAHVYVPDLPGHGQSDHETRPLTISELAEALGRWMDACELKSALLVGHSFGCQIAVELAVQRPELAAGLLLIGPTSDPSARSSAKHIARGLRTSLYERPTGSVWLTLDYKRAGLRVLSREMREMISHRIEERLPQVSVPVRVVRGERDRVVPQPWAEAVARLVGAPEPKVIPKWGHAVQYDDPEAVAQITLDFAESVVAGQGTDSEVNELTV